MRFHSILLCSVGLTFAAGCSQSTTGETASSEAHFTSDQVGTDVQVLQVWTPGRLFPQAAQPWQSPTPSDVTIDSVDPNACTTLRTSVTQGTSLWENREVDCTAALAKATPFDVTNVPGPVMTDVRFTVSKQVSNGYTRVDPDYCSRIELRAVVRDAALSQPSFTGIGFYTSRGETFIPKAQLQAVGHARLVSGEDATVYRFTGLSTCISSAHNSTSGNAFQTFSFKPYAAYEAPGEHGETNRYRVWENIAGNHAIGRSWPGATPRVDSQGFDRQHDLLAQ